MEKRNFCCLMCDTELTYGKKNSAKKRGRLRHCMYLPVIVAKSLPWYGFFAFSNCNYTQVFDTRECKTMK